MNCRSYVIMQYSIRQTLIFIEYIFKTNGSYLPIIIYAWFSVQMIICSKYIIFLCVNSCDYDIILVICEIYFDVHTSTSRNRLVPVPVVDGLIFTPAVHLEVSHFSLFAPVQSWLYRGRTYDRVMGIVWVGERPLLDCRQVFH